MSELLPILVFLCLSVLDLGPMYATDRQTSDAHHRLMPPPCGGGAYQTRVATNYVDSPFVCYNAHW